MKEESSKFVGWAIVSDGRAQFVGKIADEVDGVVTMCPAFEWVCPASVDARHGTIQRGRLALPLETFPSLDTVRVRPACVVPLDRISERDAAELDKALRRRESAPAAPPRIIVASPLAKQ